MKNRKLTASSFVITKEYGKISAVVKTALRECLLSVALISLGNTTMQAGAIILSAGLKPWIANNTAEEERLII
jgi:hypothetical protein